MHMTGVTNHSLVDRKSYNRGAAKPAASRAHTRLSRSLIAIGRGAVERDPHDDVHRGVAWTEIGNLVHGVAVAVAKSAYRRYAIGGAADDIRDVRANRHKDSLFRSPHLHGTLGTRHRWRRSCPRRPRYADG